MQYHSALTHVPVGLVPWTETAPAPPVRSRGQSQLTSCIHYLVMNEQNPHASLLPTHPLTTPVPPANHHCHPPLRQDCPLQLHHSVTPPPCAVLLSVSLSPVRLRRQPHLGCRA